MNFLQVGLFMMLVIGLAFGPGRARSGGRSTPIRQKGVQFQVGIARAKNKEVQRAWLVLDMPDTLRFRLRGERWFDRIAKNFGVVREWQTGDAAFDERVFIVSEDQSFIGALSAKRALRDLCVQVLVSREQGEIECKRGKLYFDCKASGSRDTVDETIAQALVLELGDSLIKLRDGL